MASRPTKLLLVLSASAAGIAFAATSGTPLPQAKVRLPAATATPAAASKTAAAATTLAETIPDAPVLALAEDAATTFHDSDTMKCGTQKVHIDSPARAFKDQNGTVHLTVSDPNAAGWQWTGANSDFTAEPKTATLDCTSVMTGNVAASNPLMNDPTKFDQKTWIQAVFFQGSTVYAYGHEDYYGTRTAETGCHDAGTSDGLPQCWYASIPLWTSSTSATHLSFARSATAPDHGAIYPHVQYPGHSSTPTAGWIGYGAPSNIIRGRNPDGTADGYYYIFAYASAAYSGQSKGVCLFRSGDPTDRSSWRAWNGSTTTPGFTQTMGNPYSNTNSACAVVQPGTFNTYVRSVVWHKPSRRYIAFFRSSAAVRYTTSTDLLTWSTPQNLLTSTTDQANYPVAIDLDGGDYGDSNFDRLYSNGKSYLFYRVSVASGHTQIARKRIVVSNYSADVPGPTNPD
ncbi:hypothetical protein P6144_11295 [Sphingomonas sp. HITSZ_GF]|nr:hypothetical protein [Sphingomonas sp. HITSZ_GF]